VIATDARHADADDFRCHVDSCRWRPALAQSSAAITSADALRLARDAPPAGALHGDDLAALVIRDEHARARAASVYADDDALMYAPRWAERPWREPRA
jgi:hypothetical protein